jgi:hypothetical protein
MLGFDGTNPPRAIGRVRLSAATIGGEARSTLTADITLPLSRKPDIEFGTAAASVIIEGDGSVVTGTLMATQQTSETENTESEYASV